MFERLFELAPDPRGLLGAEQEELSLVLKPLGLQNRRAQLLRRLTVDYLDGKPPKDIHGVGQYDLDAWAIFVEGRTGLRPADHFLKPYLEWRKKRGTKIEWGGDLCRRAVA